MGVRRGVLLVAALTCATPARAGNVTVLPGGPGIGPAELGARYEAGTAAAGAGVRIAVLATGDVEPGDVAAFRAAAGLPPMALERIVAGAAVPGDPTMTVLAEWAGVLAPAAGIVAVVGDPWKGIAAVIGDDLADVVVLPDLPFPTTDILRRIALLAALTQSDRHLLVPAGTELLGAATAPIAVTGTMLAGDGEEMALDGTVAGDVAALASPTAPGYRFRWLGAERCCAGGTGVAAAVWAGALAAARAVMVEPIPARPFLTDAARRQEAGGIAAFRAVAPDGVAGFGVPRVAGLVDATACFGAECGSEPDPSPEPCARGVCLAGGVCERRPLEDGSLCTAAGDVCTVGQTCAAGACVGGMPLDCTDTSECTTDACTPYQGCTHRAAATGGTCGFLSPARGGHCGLVWLFAATAETTDPRHVVCADGDPACDRDPAPGRCAFALSACLTDAADCPPRLPALRQPSRRGARRSAAQAAARQALRATFLRALAPGECSPAALVPVAAGRSVRVRVEGSGRVRLECTR